MLTKTDLRVDLHNIRYNVSMDTRLQKRGYTQDDFLQHRFIADSKYQQLLMAIPENRKNDFNAKVIPIMRKAAEAGTVYEDSDEKYETLFNEISASIDEVCEEFGQPDQEI